MTQLTPHELIASARDNEARNGRVFGIVLQREWTGDILALAAELETSLDALRIAAPYVTGTQDGSRVHHAVQRLSRVLGS